MDGEFEVPDRAEQHKSCVLKAADDYYRGRTNGGDAVLAIRECFNESLKDGSAEELFRKLKNTSVGSPDVQLLREGDKESLYIKAGFWELGKERESQLTFKVAADMSKKTAEVTTDTWTFTLPAWLTR
jgi:hypothetical protein